jgi:hypothetical protein
MKKLLVIFFLSILIFPLQLRADDDFNLLDDEALWNDIEAFRANTANNQGNAAENSGSESYRLKDRSIEVGLANLEVGFPSSLLKKVFVINLEDLSGYFVNLSLTPFYFKYANDNWGFNVFTGAEAFGNIALSEKLLSFAEGVDKKSELAGAAFAEAGLGGFFRLGKFKLKAGAAGFVPLFYAYQEKIDYSLGDSLTLDYCLRLYSAITDKGFKMGNKLGIDMRLGAEYPLASFLDLGLDVANIPIKKGVLTDYQRYEGTIEIGGDEMFKLPESEEVEWQKGKKEIARPFKTLVWADWRPFDTRLFSVIGAAGFQINQMYKVPFSMEGGLKARFDWANIIIVTAGARYEDRLWKNGVDIALNGRAFELDLGIDMRSPDFVESWFKSSFLGLSFGIKAGW